MEQDNNHIYEGNTCQRVFPVFEKYRSELVGYVYSKLGDILQSEALVSDVMVKLYRNCEKLDEIKNIRAWLYQITRRTLADYFREQGKKSLITPELVEEQAQDSNSFQSELASLVSVMIDCLPEKYAIPLRLSDLEGMSQQAIADQLNLSLSGAKSRVQRAREQLKDMFHQCLHLELDHRGIPVDFRIKSSCDLTLDNKQSNKLKQLDSKNYRDNCDC